MDWHTLGLGCSYIVETPQGERPCKCKGTRIRWSEERQDFDNYCPLHAPMLPPKDPCPCCGGTGKKGEDR